MNLNEKLKNYLTHEENDFLKVENSYNKKTSYLVGFEFASGSIDKIFDPYFTTKQALHGTGLGLYMSSIILNEHFNKGFIKVSNTQNSFGVGACFEITIPKIPTTKIDS